MQVAEACPSHHHGSNTWDRYPSTSINSQPQIRVYRPPNGHLQFVAALDDVLKRHQWAVIRSTHGQLGDQVSPEPGKTYKGLELAGLEVRVRQVWNSCWYGSAGGALRWTRDCGLQGCFSGLSQPNGPTKIGGRCVGGPCSNRSLGGGTVHGHESRRHQKTQGEANLKSTK